MRDSKLIIAAMGSFCVALLTGCLETSAPVMENQSTDTSPSEPLAKSGAKIPGKYIVSFSDDVDDVESVVRELGLRHGLGIEHTYKHALKGFSGTVPPGVLKALEMDPRVKHIEEDQVVTVLGEIDAAAPGKGGGGGTVEPQVQTLPWGIDRVDADVSSTLAGNGSGAVTNVHVYIIDTGIDYKHQDLNVVGHVNFAGGKNTDCHGHGTHVAGTVAAKDNISDVVGVAPGAPLVGVKVLGCNGSGTTSGVIKGVDWVTANAVKPAVANMSLGGGISVSLDDAVIKSANSGVVYALAAGNSSADACSSSPARVGVQEGILTVAATGQDDSEASFSNFGNCVDVWAPGVGIFSTKKGGGTVAYSGTSMASPHVAGTAALYLSSQTGADASTVEIALKSDAVPTSTLSKDGGAISLINAGSY